MNALAKRIGRDPVGFGCIKPLSLNLKLDVTTTAANAKKLFYTHDLALLIGKVFQKVVTKHL